MLLLCIIQVGKQIVSNLDSGDLCFGSLRKALCLGFLSHVLSSVMSVAFAVINNSWLFCFPENSLFVGTWEILCFRFHSLVHVDLGLNDDSLL